MFRAFRAFYIDAVSSTAPAFIAVMSKYIDDYEQWLESRQAGSVQQFLKEKPEIRIAGSKWFNCGFSMYDGEGSLLPAEDPAILLSFAHELDSSLAQYLRFLADEDRETIVNDAALEISWEELRQKIERWEAFEKGHRELPEAKSEMDPSISFFFSLYVFGSDNTPTFDSKTGRIDPKLIASWRQFTTHDRSSRYYALMSQLLTSVNNQGQTITQKDRPLFARFGMSDSFDLWWRVLQLRLSDR